MLDHTITSVKVENDAGESRWYDTLYFTQAFTPTFRKGDALTCLVSRNWPDLTEGDTYTALADSYLGVGGELVKVKGNSGATLTPYTDRFTIFQRAGEKFVPTFRKGDELRCIDSYGAGGELLAGLLYRAATDSCLGAHFEQVELLGIEGYFSVGWFELNSPTLTGKITYPHDPVNHPAHYTDTAIEVIDYIEDKQFGYHIGQVIKYLSRAGKKGDELEDLRKAQWYLNRKIELLCKK